jgi:hypothetical protein
MLRDVGSFVQAIRRVSEDHELCIRQDVLFELFTMKTKGILQAIRIVRVDQRRQVQQYLSDLGGIYVLKFDLHLRHSEKRSLPSVPWFPKHGKLQVSGRYTAPILKLDKKYECR